LQPVITDRYQLTMVQDYPTNKQTNKHTNGHLRPITAHLLCGYFFLIHYFNFFFRNIKMITDVSTKIKKGVIPALCK